MEGILITWRELLVIVILVLAVYIAEMLLLMRGKGVGALLASRRGESADTPRDVARLTGRVIELEEALSRLEADYAQFKKTLGSPYAQAIEMARQGCNPDEIAAVCGVSRGEAELITAVHKAQDT